MYYIEPLPTCIPSMWNSSKPEMTKERFAKLVMRIIESETGFNPLEKPHRRIREFCQARQILFVMLINHTNRTLTDIGNIVDKDHATVLSGIKTIANLCDTDKRFKAMFDRIEDKVKKLR